MRDLGVLPRSLFSPGFARRARAVLARGPRAETPVGVLADGLAPRCLKLCPGQPSQSLCTRARILRALSMAPCGILPPGFLAPGFARRARAVLARVPRAMCITAMSLASCSAPAPVPEPPARSELLDRLLNQSLGLELRRWEVAAGPLLVDEALQAHADGDALSRAAA